MNPKLEILKTGGVNLAALGFSLSTVEQILRILVLSASLIYTVYQLKKMFSDKTKGKK